MDIPLCLSKSEVPVLFFCFSPLLSLLLLFLLILVCAFFICCPSLLRTSQASRLIGPLGPARDEAILILSGITAGLGCSSRVRTFRHTDLRLHRHLRARVKATTPRLTSDALNVCLFLTISSNTGYFCIKICQSFSEELLLYFCICLYLPCLFHSWGMSTA